MPIIVLHHLVDSRSERIFWALEELGLPYSVIVHQRSRFGGATRSLAQSTPSGKAPSVQIDGEWVSESGYVLERLMEIARGKEQGSDEYKSRQGSIQAKAAEIPERHVNGEAEGAGGATGARPGGVQGVGAGAGMVMSVKAASTIQRQANPNASAASPAGIGSTTSTSPASSHSTDHPATPYQGSRSDVKIVDIEMTPSRSSTFFAHWAEGSLMLWMQALLVHRLTTGQFLNGRVDIKGQKADKGMKEAMKEWSDWARGTIYAPQIQKNLDVLDDFLSRQSDMYLSGSSQPGIGDFMLAYPLSSIIAPSESDRGGKEPYKIGQALRRWMGKIRERPAYQRGVARMEREEEAQRPIASAKL